MKWKIPEAGDWAVFRNDSYLGDMWDFARIERVTTKTVYAKACYLKQHPFKNVFVVEGEEAARLIVERQKSARAECDRRVSAAKAAYRNTVSKLLPTPPEAE